MSSSKPPVHTVTAGNKWTNQRAGSTRAGKNYDTKAEAQAAGRRTAMRDKVEHLIHKKDGTSANATRTATTRTRRRAERRSGREP